MSSLYRVEAFGARTTFPNTPETDKEPMVYHTVTYSIDHGESQKAYIMATEPGDAINRVNRMTVEQVSQYNVKPELATIKL